MCRFYPSQLLFSIEEHNVMEAKESSVRVYSLPDCPHCEALKGWLRARGIDFEERPFDTEAQVEFVMRNIFGNPPILEVGLRALASEEIFIEEVLDEGLVLEVVRSGEK